MQVAGAVGLVTGGASGLGLGAVRMLVDAGGRAAIVDLSGSRGEAVTAELGASAAFFPTDVTKTDQVAASVAGALEAFGRIDLCVNAAGIGTAARLVDKQGTPFPLDLYRRTIEVNLIGLFDVTRQAAAAMARNEPGADGERGLVVNVASIAAFDGQIGQAAYAASKGGIVSMTLPLARDLASWGIRVLTIAPGIMDTPMVAAGGPELAEALAKVHVFPRRLGTAADFAALVRHFMENVLLNGEVVRLDAAARMGPR